MIDTIISLLGLGYQHISGIKQGKTLDLLLKEVKRSNATIERIADGIFYFPSHQDVKIQDDSHVIKDKRAIRQLLEPIQKLANQNIAASAIFYAPEKTKTAIKNSPHSFFIDVEPFSIAQKTHNRNLVPILFMWDNQPMIGWQTKGALPQLLGFEYSPGEELGEVSTSWDREILFRKPVLNWELSNQNNWAVNWAGRQCILTLLRDDHTALPIPLTISSEKDFELNIALKFHQGGFYLAKEIGVGWGKNQMTHKLLINMEDRESCTYSYRSMYLWNPIGNYWKSGFQRVISRPFPNNAIDLIINKRGNDLLLAVNKDELGEVNLPTSNYRQFFLTAKGRGVRFSLKSIRIKYLK